VFLSDSDDPGELVSRGRCGGLRDGSPAAESRGEPLVEVRGTKLTEIGVWGRSPMLDRF